VEEISTLARPYADAAYDHAHATASIEAWSKQMAGLAAIAADAGLAAALIDPRLKREQHAEIVLGAASDLGLSLGEGVQNLVRVLAENQRLSVMPEIARQFAQRRAADQKLTQVDITSAMEMDAASQEQLAEALRQRLGTDVNVQVQVDPSLIGGAIVRAGDLVIDASVRGRLAQLETVLRR
jgi:F-type H+-transporting ATPase subunit delta